jgi:hypothetical protein
MCFLDEMMESYISKNHCANTNGTCHQQQFTPFNDSLHKKPTQNEDQETILREGYITAYLNEMQYNHSESQSSFQFLPPLWSMEPRIFALETSISGKRKYIVGNLGRFIHHYFRKSDPFNRHYYELIRENTPCRLYFGKCLSVFLLLTMALRFLTMYP